MHIRQDECSNCGSKNNEVVIVKGYNGNAGLCYTCILDVVSLLLEEGETPLKDGKQDKFSHR